MSTFTLVTYSRDYPDESDVVGVYSSFENAVKKIIRIWEMHRDTNMQPYIVRDAPYGTSMEKTRDQFISFVYGENGKVYDSWGDLYKIREFIVDRGPKKRRHNGGRRKPKIDWD